MSKPRADEYYTLIPARNVSAISAVSDWDPLPLEAVILALVTDPLAIDDVLESLQKNDKENLYKSCSLPQLTDLERMGAMQRDSAIQTLAAWLIDPKAISNRQYRRNRFLLKQVEEFSPRMAMFIETSVALAAIGEISKYAILGPEQRKDLLEVIRLSRRLGREEFEPSEALLERLERESVIARGLTLGDDAMDELDNELRRAISSIAADALYVGGYTEDDSWFGSVEWLLPMAMADLERNWYQIPEYEDVGRDHPEYVRSLEDRERWFREAASSAALEYMRR